MKKADKEKIKTMMDSIMSPLGVTFRFSNQWDSSFMGRSDGYFDHTTTTKMEIVCRQTADYMTVAHEFAHAIQYHQEGDTACNSTRVTSKNRHYVVDMIERFYQWEAKCAIALCKLGVETEWNKASGISHIDEKTGERCYVESSRRQYDPFMKAIR